MWSKAWPRDGRLPGDTTEELSAYKGGSGIVRLHGQDATPIRPRDLPGEEGSGEDLPWRHRAGDRQATRVDGRNVIGRSIDEDHLLTGAYEGRTERGSDGTGSPDQNGIGRWSVHERAV